MATTPGRGRSSLETHAAAVARIASLASDRDGILDAHNRVIGSAAFQSSKRARELFSYVVECAVSGRADELKERSLGHALFGRDPAYDTGSDAIVRVAASDVRKRLLAYYRETPEDPVVFELPPGSYVPTIRLAAEPVSAPADLVAAELVHTPDLPGVVKPMRRFPWKMVAIASWILCLGAIAGLVAQRHAPTSGGSKRPLGLPWSALFRGRQPLQVILADSSMGSLRNIKPFPATIEDFANYRFMTPDPSLDPALRRVWGHLAKGRLTSIADARISARIGSLAASMDKPFAIRSARDVQLAELQNASSLVLLGSGASNPWVMLYEKQMSFHIVWESPGQSVSIRDPRPGDPRDLGPTVGSGATGRGYAVLALLRSLDGEGSVLLAMGTSMEGTEMAGDLAFNGEKLTSILRGCGLKATDSDAHFEILLGLDVTAGSQKDFEVLSTRCSAGR